MTTPLLIINGVTGTGKTTATRHLCSKWSWNSTPFTYIHPIGYLKRFLESVYQCPNLDTTEGKLYQAPGSPSTMQQIMVRQWEIFVQEALDPDFSQRLMAREISQIPRTTPLVFNAIRNMGEANFLLSVAALRGMTPYFVRLTTPASRPEPSDVYEGDIAYHIAREIPGKQVWTVQNNLASMPLFESQLDVAFEQWEFTAVPTTTTTVHPA